MAMSAVSASRISPTRMMFGACRSMARRILAKSRPIPCRTSDWLTPWRWYSTGFSIVQESVPDELRGRAFGVLSQALRLALLGGLTLWPVVSTVLQDEVGGRRFAIGDFGHTLDGARVTLWLAGLAIFLVGLLATRLTRRAASDEDAQAVTGTGLAVRP